MFNQASRLRWLSGVCLGSAYLVVTFFSLRVANMWFPPYSLYIAFVLGVFSGISIPIMIFLGRGSLVGIVMGFSVVILVITQQTLFQEILSLVKPDQDNSPERVPGHFALILITTSLPSGIISYFLSRKILRK
jgi:hypothetical protein